MTDKTYIENKDLPRDLCTVCYSSYRNASKMTNQSIFKRLNESKGRVFSRRYDLCGCDFLIVSCQ